MVQVTRQSQAMKCNEPCAKLLSLFMYETVRPQGMPENVYPSSLLSLSPFILSSLSPSLTIPTKNTPRFDLRRYHASCACRFSIPPTNQCRDSWSSTSNLASIQNTLSPYKGRAKPTSSSFCSFAMVTSCFVMVTKIIGTLRGRQRRPMSPARSPATPCIASDVASDAPCRQQCRSDCLCRQRRRQQRRQRVCQQLARRLIQHNRDHSTILCDVISSSHLECRICVSTYR